MIQLFKNKSLKSNTKRKEGANGMSAQGAGVGAEVSAGTQSSGNRNANKQSGRSMVEMLGVLAIIGVLSIGGISGYTMAMRRYRANEIINLVNKYAMTVYASCQNQMITNPAQYDKYGSVISGAGMAGRYMVCDRVPFTDSGLGALPQGVMKLGEYQDEYKTRIWYNVHYGITIMSRSSGDIINVPIIFDNKALCETVMNITGSSGADAVVDYIEPCSENERYSGYLYNIVIVNN